MWRRLLIRPSQSVLSSASRSSPGNCSLLVVIAILTVLAGCRPAVREDIMPAGRLGMVSFVRPETPPDAFVFFFSVVDGWNAGLDEVAHALARQGVAVVGIDLPQYLRNLAASDDGCHYVISELEDMSERLQRDLQVAGYESPILAGIGAGGTLAYAALAQAPAATIAGAISVDPAAALDTRVALCKGAPVTAAASGGFTYGPQPNLPGWWQVSTATQPSPELSAVIAASHGVVASVQGSPTQRLQAMLSTVLARAGHADSGRVLSDLPLVPLPVSQPGQIMAVIYSGDGGWRDLDKQIAGVLVQQQVPVVGVDSLRYFWNEKTPDQVAADLSRIIRQYTSAWQRPKVVLVGYSFGADILPFALNRLPTEDRARVLQVSLLGLEPQADFTVHLAGWFSGEPDRTAPPVLPEILRQDLALFQCFYGADEEDTLCRAPQLAAAELIGTSGGHHFGGDYAALAREILDGASRRLAAGTAAGPSAAALPKKSNDLATCHSRESGNLTRGDANIPPGYPLSRV